MNTYIDPTYASEESLLLRYHKGIAFERITRDDLKAVSVKEGARIIRLLEYKGVAVHLADESTLMSTGTFKALEACFIIAVCKKRKYDRIVFSSGSNLGSALTFYGRKAGIETFFFHPKSTSWKLDRDIFDAPDAHLISVDKPEKEVKKAAQVFAGMSGIKHVPEMEWRFLATGLRAFFVFEFVIKTGIHFDWISQAICAGYGPIGFYNITQKSIAEGAISKKHVPKFLGIQQESLSPMVRAWQRKHHQIQSEDLVAPSHDLLDPSLYNTNPDASYPILYQHLIDFGGELCPLNRREYENHLPLLLKQLALVGIHLNSRVLNGKEQILENAGLMNVAGTLKAIDHGLIKKGETVLSFFTGGAGVHSGKEAVPEYKISQEDGLTSATHNYLEMVRLKSLPAQTRT